MASIKPKGGIKPEQRIKHQAQDKNRSPSQEYLWQTQRNMAIAVPGSCVLLNLQPSQIQPRV